MGHWERRWGLCQGMYLREGYKKTFTGNNLHTAEPALDSENGLDRLLRSVLIGLTAFSNGDGKCENWDRTSC